MPSLTFPLRALRLGRRFVDGFRPGYRDAPVILMYHRVADPPWDPWGLAIAPARFREQIEVLKRHRVLLSMDALAAGLAAGALPPRATAITFDDGYADNAFVAKPILEKLGAPATFFVTSGFVRSGKRFWWDELAEMVLANPAAARFEFAGTAYAWPVQHSLPSDLSGWRVGQRTSDPRRAAYVRLWSALRGMGGDERDAALGQLGELRGAHPPLAEDELGRPMSPETVRSASTDLIAIAAHGRSHVPLIALPPAARREELALARSEIAEWTGRAAPSGLAYPHGEHDAETRAMAAAAGYSWAVTSRSARIDRRHHDPLALPRLDPGRRSAVALRLALHASAC